MCLLHTRRAHLWFIPDSSKSLRRFLNSWTFDYFCQCGRNLCVFLCFVIFVIIRNIRLESYEFFVFWRFAKTRSCAPSFSAWQFPNLKNQEMTTNFMKMCI